MIGQSNSTGKQSAKNVDPAIHRDAFIASMLLVTKQDFTNFESAIVNELQSIDWNEFIEEQTVQVS